MLPSFSITFALWLFCYWAKPHSIFDISLHLGPGSGYKVHDTSLHFHPAGYIGQSVGMAATQNGVFSFIFLWSKPGFFLSFAIMLYTLYWRLLNFWFCQRLIFYLTCNKANTVKNSSKAFSEAIIKILFPLSTRLKGLSGKTKTTVRQSGIVSLLFTNIQKQ